jgi:hypothetical protein
MTQKIKNKQINIATPFDFNNQRLYNLASPTGSTDATNKEYVDSNAINYSLGTGLYSGGIVTIDDNTHFSITSGVGYIVDSITKYAIIVKFTAKSGVTLMDIGETDITVSIAIDINGDVFQQVPVFTPIQRRNYIVLGELFVNPLTQNLSAVWYRPVFSWDTSTIVDCEYLAKCKSIIGNSISPNGSNLLLDVSSGEMQGYSINAINSFTNPNYMTFTGETAFSFITSFHNGTEWVFQTEINQIEPQYYSNGSTSLQSVANNKWSIRLLMRGAITGKLYLSYPTHPSVYNDSSTAKADLINLIYLIPDELSTVVVPCMFLIVRGAAIDLSITTDAVFVPVQAINFTAGASASVLAYDVVFDNSGSTNLVSVDAQNVINEINNKIENLNYSSDVNMVANSGVSGIYLACNTGITAEPATRVGVFLNSIEVPVGNGTTSEVCYFSSDSGVTAKAWNNITLGDHLYWNGSIAPFQLETTDGLSFEYLII